MNRIYFILFLLIPICTSQTIAQNVSFEEIKELCNSNTPTNERVRVTVIRFSSRMNTAYSQLGSELATILTNALYQVKCFNVLESASNLEDFDKEFEMKNKGYSNSNAPEKGKMLGAEAIITGEITEYAEGKKSIRFSGLSVGSNKAHVGFILKVLHAETREILYSESINMESKSNGFTGLKVLGLKVAGSENRSKALNNAVEKAIIKATELLAKSKDQWVERIHSEKDNEKKNIIIIASNIDYSKYLLLENTIKSSSEILFIDKSFKSNTGEFIVNNKGTSNQLAMFLTKELKISFEIKEVTDQVIKLTAN